MKPGDKVLLIHEGRGIYPPAPCTVIEKMIDGPAPCPTCGQPWPGHRPPDHWTQNPSYLLKFDYTGAQGIYPARRVQARD